MGEVAPYIRVLEAANYTPPAPLIAANDVSKFDCGKPPLNDWLRNTALKAEGKSARCYVTCSKGAVAGFYCLAAGAVTHEGAPRKLRQNMPDPTPVVIIGRLAVDLSHQGRGMGRGLLKDALLRIIKASDMVGARAVLVHAVDQESVPFYAKYKFRTFPLGNQTLYLPIDEIIASL